MIDVNDPATWPEGLAELAKLADQPDLGTVEPQPEVRAEAEVLPENPPEATEKVDPARDDKGRFAKAEVPEEALPSDPLLLTPDGKSVLSFDVLVAERARVAALEAQLAALQGQPAPASAASVVTPAAEPEPEFSTEQLAKAEQLTKDWGQAIADLYLDNLRAGQQVAKALSRAEKAEQVADALRKQAEAQQAREQQSEDAQVQAAIDNNPLMLAWQADKDSPFFKRAVALHQQLMENDPDYAKLPWGDRFAALPGKVEAVYGASPHSAKLAAAKPVPAKSAQAKVPEPEVPLSLSDLPAGGAPVADPSTEIARMTGPQLQRKLATMAPDALRAFLSQVH
jgi:hypothetical protein